MARHAGQPWDFGAKVRWVLAGLPFVLLIIGFVVARETNHTAVAVLCLVLIVVTALAGVLPAALALRREARQRDRVDS